MITPEKKESLLKKIEIEDQKKSTHYRRSFINSAMSLLNMKGGDFFQYYEWANPKNTSSISQMNNMKCGLDNALSYFQHHIDKVSNLRKNEKFKHINFSEYHGNTILVILIENRKDKIESLITQL